MKAADYLLGALKSEGVDHIFCVPGGLIDPLLPAMSETGGVTPIVAAHEAGAAYMADGYARASGRFGSCFAIGGPGVSNMSTAVSAARSDGSPILVISGQIALELEGRGGFQDDSPGTAIDDTAALAPLVVSSQEVLEPHLLGHHLRLALSSMLAVPRGPAHLAIATDIQDAEVTAPPPPSLADRYRPRLIDEAAFAGLERMLSGDDGPKRIAILAGAGVEHSEATESLTALAERYEIPVATTLRAKGVFPEAHPLSIGVFGYAGTRHATEALLDPSLEALIVVGSGLNQRDTMFWDKKMSEGRLLIHADVDPTVIGRTWPAESGIVADARTLLDRLGDPECEAAAALASGAGERRQWLADVRATGSLLYDLDHCESDSRPIHPARVIADLRAASSPDTTLVVDSGAHRAFCGHYWSSQNPRQYISATNIGPMGWAIPAAIGAKLARPDSPVTCVTGDGCMLMHGLEIQTAARYGVDVTFVLINNGALGNVWLRAHEKGPGPAAMTEIPIHDWAAIAKGLGAGGIRVEDPDELTAAFEEAQATPGPVLIDVRCDRSAATPVAPWQQAKSEWVDSD